MPYFTQVRMRAAWAVGIFLDPASRRAAASIRSACADDDRALLGRSPSVFAQTVLQLPDGLEPDVRDRPGCGRRRGHGRRRAGVAGDFRS